MWEMKDVTVMRSPFNGLDDEWESEIQETLKDGWEPFAVVHNGDIWNYFFKRPVTPEEPEVKSG